VEDEVDGGGTSEGPVQRTRDASAPSANGAATNEEGTWVREKGREGEEGAGRDIDGGRRRRNVREGWSVWPSVLREREAVLSTPLPRATASPANGSVGGKRIEERKAL
jgi:hypothetical protein